METNIQPTVWDKVLKMDVEYNRFGIISALLLIVGCMGGVTVGLGAIHSIVQLSLVVFPTMIALTLLLAVMPVKHILNASAIAVSIDVILIIYNLLV